MRTQPFLDAWTCRRVGIPGPVPGTAPDRAFQVERFQVEALGRTLAHARANSRFYKNHLAGVRTSRIRHLADLAGLPFTFPGQLRGGAGSFACLSQDQVSRIFTLDTSGTTARPKRLWFSREDLDRTVDFFAACLEALMAPGDRGLIFLPGTTPFSAGDLIRRAMVSVGAVPRVNGLVTDGATAAGLIRETCPAVIIGMPVQVLVLGEILARSGEDVPEIPYAILTADHVSPPVAARVERLFRCRALSHYGMTETGFGGAIQCPKREGLHLRHPDLVVEIVDPGTGQLLPPGEQGEIVVTTLNRRAMPLIRYRTGDVARLMAQPCACGSPLPRLDRVRSRQAEGLDLGSGLVLTMADLDDALFTLAEVVDFTAEIDLEILRPVLSLGVETLAPVKVDSVTACLMTVPAVKKAVDTGRLSLGNIEIRACAVKNTYLGKRRIREHLECRKDTPHEIL